METEKTNPQGFKRYTAISVLKKVVIVVLIEGNWADVSQPFSFFFCFLDIIKFVS